VNARPFFFTAAGSLRAPWRLLFFALALLACSLLADALFAPIAGSIFNAVGLRGETFASVLDVVSGLAATWLALRWLDHRPWSDVALDAPAARPRLMLSGFALGGAAIALPILVLIVMGWLHREAEPSIGWGHAFARTTVILLPAAFAEEIITRGYILTVLRDALNWRWAVAITSVAFGLLHLGNPGANAQSVVLVALAGVFLAAVRIATDSLYAAWMAHFAWNWVMAAAFHAPVSGFAFDVPGYRYVDAGPDWATGGAWGPESGIPAGLAMITGIGLLLMRLRRSRTEGDG
jgi:CAAX protease family protein